MSEVFLAFIESNGTIIIYDGPVIDSSFESWNCQVQNYDGTELITVYTTSICMKNN